MDDSMFRTLSPEDEAGFRQWARDNHTPYTAPNPVWHPVVRDEWRKLDEQAEDEAGFVHETEWAITL